MENDLDAMFEQLDANDENNAWDFGNGESDDSFNEEDYNEILDRLSLMDRERYVELLRQQHKARKMREALVHADLDDDATALSKSHSVAGGINSKHKNLVSDSELKIEYDKIE